MAFAVDASTPFSFFCFFLRTPTILARGWASVSGLCFGLYSGTFWTYSDSGDEWQHERDFVFELAICTPNQTVGRYRLRGLI